MNPAPGRRARCRLLLRALFAGASLATGRAQPVITLGPPAPTPPPPLVSIAGDAARATAVPSPTSPWHWGFVTLHPHASYGILYGDGIQARPGQPMSTTIHHLSGGLVADLGSRWALDYRVMQSLYSNRAFRDSLDQSGSVTGGSTYAGWTWRFFHSSAAGSLPLVETGGQTRQRSHTTVGTLAYAASPRLLLDLSLQQTLHSPENFASTREWPVRAWIHYQVARLDFAAGAAAGYVGITPGPDMHYRRPQVQLTWRPSDRLSFQVSGGRESRTFRTARPTTLHHTVFGGSANAQITRTTFLTASAERDLAVSYFSRQVSENTRQTVELRQRLLRHFQLSAGAERHRARYVGPFPLVAGGDPRGDRRRAVNVRLATTFRTRGTLALSFQRNRNDSNLEAYRFTSHQYAAEIGYRY
jgi:hypothetical protein